MVRKHLIACPGVLILMLVAKLFIFSVPSVPAEPSFNYSGSAKLQLSPETQLSSDPNSSNQLVSFTTFANEEVPLTDPYVQKQMKKALANWHFDQRQTSSLHRRAQQWFPLVESILKMYGIPEDFKYIPLVESGFKKNTSSPRGASGYWQFMPQTARVYGLRVDSLVDERQDIRKSTIAACKYLRSMFREFNSWTLVAAGYNIGENRVHEYMNRYNEDDYFKMKFNRETAMYVYNLISMKEIIENPAGHGYRAELKPKAVKKRPAEYIVPDLAMNEMIGPYLIRN